MYTSIGFARIAIAKKRKRILKTKNKKLFPDLPTQFPKFICGQANYWPYWDMVAMNEVTEDFLFNVQ